MVWQPRLGTQILIVDRETLRLVSRSETEPWYQWHFANGYEDTDGSLVIDLCRYPDFATNQYLREVATGETHTATSAQLWRLRIEPTSGRILANEMLLDRSCEFPTVAAATVGRHTEAIFLALHRRGSEIGRDYLNSLARFDPRTGRLSEADLGEGRTPSEPLCVADAEDPARAWVLTVVYDSAADTSEVWIFDAEHLEESPVCRLGLPAVIPHGFHGTWRSARG
jgi:carotenoid cleavage dioxygenase-like enzyme